MPTRPTLDRRRFMKTTGTFSLTAGLAGFPHLSLGNRSKPNLLFLWTDEQRADTMAIYGNKRIQTPNLNRLAAESTVFEKAYVSQPVCTPSRSTVMTGLWPHTNSCTQNNIPLPLDIPCFPELLDDPDYHAGYFGKWHLGDEVFPQHGFGEWVSIEDGYRRYYREERDQDQKSSYFHFLKDLGYEPDTDSGHFSRGFAARRPLEHCKPKFLERNACDFIRRHRNEPFILYVNFLEPHMPFYGPLDDLHSPGETRLPDNYDDPLEENEPLAYRLKRAHFRENGFEGHDLKTESGWRRLIANYWGLCSQVDLSVGEILRTLEREGLAENTIVVYTSDHGDMMGAHQMLAKTVMYEESVRVPWLMRIPQTGFTHQVIHHPVSNIDMVPTLLDLFGKERDERLAGHSLTGVLKGEDPLQDHVFIEWNPAGNRASRYAPALHSVSKDEASRALASHTRTVVTPDGWKLCLNTKDKNQLFNLAEDPGETTNLYDSGRHKDRIAALTKRIRQWQESVEDIVEI